MSTTSQLRVLIAEDQALVRQGIAALLIEDAAHINEVDNGEDALHHLKQDNFDIALIDIGLPRRTGLDVLTELRSSNNQTKIILLTGDTDTYSPRQIYSAGADGFLYKTDDASHFRELFLAVANGEKLSAPMTEDSDNIKELARLKETLSSRELQVIKLVVEGLSNKKIGETLFISEHTVRKHREHVNQKLSIRSPLALAHFAIKTGLV